MTMQRCSQHAFKSEPRWVFIKFISRFFKRPDNYIIRWPAYIYDQLNKVLVRTLRTNIKKYILYFIFIE